MGNLRTETATAQGLDWLTPKDVQEELRLGEKAVYRLLRNGTIPNVRLGGVYRIHRKHLDEALFIGAVPEQRA